MAARIIEPATGASTCAFGSHRCTINIGNFTRNAMHMRSHMAGLPYMNIENLSGMLISSSRCLLDLIFMIIKSNGSEAVTVYIIRYILAWSRSGWYPHSMISAIVGISDASNAI
jgi:hypothetical protein